MPLFLRGLGLRQRSARECGNLTYLRGPFDGAAKELDVPLDEGELKVDPAMAVRHQLERFAGMVGAPTHAATGPA